MWSYNRKYRGAQPPHHTTPVLFLYVVRPEKLQLTEARVTFDGDTVPNMVLRHDREDLDLFRGDKDAAVGLAPEVLVARDRARVSADGRQFI